MKEFLRDVRKNPWWVDQRSLLIKYTVSSIVLALAALAMLIMNIRHESTVMAYCSVVLVVGFVISAIVSGVFHKSKAAALIISILVCFVLSVFAVSGGNEGFAILWILLVPLFAIGLLGVHAGFNVGTYFLIFLFVLFYSPLQTIIVGKYSGPFCGRFPVLYLCDYLISMFLSFQREFYYAKAHKQSYTDEMTNTFNRRYFMNRMTNVSLDNEDNIGIVIMDLNGLKTANDTYGHDAGDEIIKALPMLCKQVWGEHVTLARMGGDEYAILLRDEDEKVLSDINEIKELAKQWRGEYIKKLSFSAGWASRNQYPDTCMLELYRKADEKMYEDKQGFYRLKANDRRKRDR